MLGWVGGLDGGTAAGVIIFADIIGLLCLYHARKLEAKLLYYAGFTVFFIGLLYLGPFVDLITILTTGKNIDNSYGLYGILSYMWVAPALVLAMYIGAELLVPKGKKVVVVIYLILGVAFELFLFLDTKNSFTFTIPAEAGTGLIDSSFNRSSPTFLLIAAFLVSVIVFNGLGFLSKALKSIGIVKKKFYSLSIGFIIFSICGAFDSLVSPGIGLVIVRIGMISSTVLMYNGLKTPKM